MGTNYDAMNNAELRAYILQHRGNLDAMETFFVRRSPDSEATWFAPPKTEAEWQQQMNHLARFWVLLNSDRFTIKHELL